MAEAMPAQSDVRPVVARSKPSNLGLWAFMVLLVAGGAWLFAALSANRADLAGTGPTNVAADPAARISSPPPLALPQDYRARGEDPRAVWLVPRDPQPLSQPDLPPPPRPARAVTAGTFGGPFVGAQASLPPPPPRQPSVVYDAALTPPAASGPKVAENDRVMAGRLASPAFTVPQGTVIPAVLETALDSTRGGLVRALVQRNVAGFDGSRVLVPRGSRLYGEYEADLAPGQKRALIRWTRLLRPDGVTIALDSPASDPLGRAGVKGKVDSKFFQRFGGAIVQSVLDIGVGVATRKASDGVIVALPGSTQNVAVNTSGQVQPTLKVRHGTSVSVFVARDLDFSSVDN